VRLAVARESALVTPMSIERPPLPDFQNPPVVEVALAVQFEPLTALRTPHLGLLWSIWRDRFGKTEEHPPLDPVMERFGTPALLGGGPGIRIASAPPVPRCWFLNESGTELIQVQQDRFVHNWRKTGVSDTYPRYEAIRTRFMKELAEFCRFVKDEKLGELTPTQCEVTYVNHMRAKLGWENQGQVNRVLAVWSGMHSDEFLGEPEDVRLAVRHVMRDDTQKPVGRLHISLQPGYLREDDEPILVLTLTARGAPEGQGIDAVCRFIDRGRTWIVSGFASVTTAEMHKIWGRCDEH